MSVNLITGKRGAAHVSAANVARENKSLYGSDDLVFDEGNTFAYSIQSNTLVRVKDGIALMQGRWVAIDTDTYEDVSIATGTTGNYRNDLIMIKYSRTSEGIENAEIVVLQGTAGSSAADPTYTKGDIDDGDDVAYMPLYRVSLNGLSIESVTKLFTKVSGNLLGLLNTPYGTDEPDSTITSQYYDQLID